MTKTHQDKTELKLKQNVYMKMKANIKERERYVIVTSYSFIRRCLNIALGDNSFASNGRLFQWVMADGTEYLNEFVWHRDKQLMVIGSSEWIWCMPERQGGRW